MPDLYLVGLLHPEYLDRPLPLLEHDVLTPAGPGAGNNPQTPKKKPQKPDPSKQGVTGKNPSGCKPVEQGVKEAKNDIKNKEACANLFDGRGAELLDTTIYVFTANFDSIDTVARTIPVTGNVEINSNGLFVTYMPQEGGVLPFGRQWTRPQFRGLTFLHELGHKAGVFGPDRGNEPVNNAHTYAVMRACFGG